MLFNCTQPQKFQELEEQRLTFLRNEMWTYCNLNSQSLVQVDEVRGGGGRWRTRVGKGREDEEGRGGLGSV